MPRLFAIGVLLLIISFSSAFKIHHQYQKEVMASSMQYGEALPLWGGDSKGQLHLGHTLLSKDGKTLAVEIKYDPDAHNELSSFGNRYRLRLIKIKDDPIDVSMEYGIFSTDGSGVLTVHSSKGFQDKAFIVMLVDNGHLVSSSDLQSQSTMNDSDLNKSITAQLSAGNTDGNTSDSSDETKPKLPPIYIVRLNALNAQRATRNWDNDRQLTSDLFIKKNLGKIKDDEDKLEHKLTVGKDTRKEMKDRLKENPDDQISTDNLTNLNGQIDNLQNQMVTNEQNYERLRNSSISKDILAPKQRHYTTYEVNTLDQVMSEAKSAD